jgi:hypothetical protein
MPRCSSAGRPRAVRQLPGIDDLIAAAGFRIERLDTGYLRGRSPFSYMYQGVARPAQ